MELQLHRFCAGKVKKIDSINQQTEIERSHLEYRGEGRCESTADSQETYDHSFSGWKEMSEML